MTILWKNFFSNRLQLSTCPSPVLSGISLVDTPGILRSPNLLIMKELFFAIQRWETAARPWLRFLWSSWVVCSEGGPHPAPLRRAQAGHLRRVPQQHRGDEGARGQDQDRAQQGRHGRPPGVDACLRGFDVESGQGQWKLALSLLTTYNKVRESFISINLSLGRCSARLR